MRIKAFRASSLLDFRAIIVYIFQSTKTETSSSYLRVRHIKLKYIFPCTAIVILWSDDQPMMSSSANIEISISPRHDLAQG